MQTIIQVQNISKTYQNQVALKQCSFELKEGKIYGLLGRNGAGKTTLLNILCNYKKTSSGEVLLFGKPFQRDLLKDIGVMIEGPAFYGSLSGQENLDIIRQVRKLPKEDLLNALKTVDLLEAKDKLYKHYSLGMRQKLYIAQAIMHKPKLLILDEPINGLDPIGIAHLRRLFHKLTKEENTTIILSSHLLKELEQVADELLILKDGRLIKKGEKHTIMQNMEQTYDLQVDEPKKVYRLLQNTGYIKKSTITGTSLQLTLEKDTPISHVLSLLLKQDILIHQVDRKNHDLEDLFHALLKEVVL